MQALPAAQALPHAPQLLALSLVFVSQPFVWLPSQLRKEPKQPTRTHVPPLHVPVPFGNVQALPHAPQWLGLVIRLASHPLVRLLVSQSAKPAEQVPVHWPLVQAGVTLLVLQEAPQPPQFEKLWLVLTSQPSTRLSALQSA